MQLRMLQLCPLLVSICTQMTYIIINTYHCKQVIITLSKHLLLQKAVLLPWWCMMELRNRGPYDLTIYNRMYVYMCMYHKQY